MGIKEDGSKLWGRPMSRSFVHQAGAAELGLESFKQPSEAFFKMTWWKNVFKVLLGLVSLGW